MKSALVRWFAGVLVVWLALWAWPVWAQTTATVSCRASATKVGVGDVFTVRMDAMVEDGPMPQSPSLRAPSTFSKSPPSISTRTMAQMAGSSVFIQRGIGVSWRLRATHEGTFTIPAPTVSIDGRTVTAKCELRIKVAKAGSGVATGPDDDSDDDDDLDNRSDDDLSSLGQRLALDAAPDRYAFVRIVADKTDVVVGEQVTLAFYFYSFGRYRQVGLPREPALTDFLRFPLDRVPGLDSSVMTRAGDRPFKATLIDTMAVFPVRAGKLKTGAMKIQFTARSFRNRVQSRLSNDLTINVRKPPKQGRPAGYRLGDTGHYQLSATVTPRRAHVGDSVAAEVILSGSGALPASLKLPERTGVEWLPPEKHEQISVQNGKIGGLRTFRYAVRLGRAGRVDLGTVTLPHYDPDARRYRMASAALGVIEVSPRAGKTTAGAGGAAAATGSDEEEDAFASVAGVRSVLRPYRGVGDEGMSPLWLWSLVMVPPLLVLAGGGLWRGAGGVRALRHKRAVDPALLAKRTLRELSGKAGAKDTAAAAARALHYAIEAASGVKARGVMLNELADKLTAAGLSSAVAAEVTALLRDCEALRFEPDADAGKVNGLPQRARDVVAQLLKRR